MIGHTAPRALDIERMSPKMIDAALAVTAGKLRLSSTAQAFCKLAAGDPAATGYFRYELARQVAGALLMIDRNVLAVYEEQDPVVEEIGADPPQLFAPLRVLVRVRWETAALRPVLDDINSALSDALRESMGRPRAPFVVATVICDDDAWVVGSRDRLHRPAPQLLADRDDVPADLD